MAREGPTRSYTEPKLSEPFESLVSWQGRGAEPGSNAAEEAKARLQALLARDLFNAITAFNVTTSRLNLILVLLTAGLVFLGMAQLLILKK